MERIVYQTIASCVDARLRCIEHQEQQPHLAEWIDKHRERADMLVYQYLPSGSGFDSGTKLDWDRSTGDKLVFHTSFHHMDQHGGYDGWTEHDVIVHPSLIHTLDLRVRGRNRNDIKDYIHESFYTGLTARFVE